MLYSSFNQAADSALMWIYGPDAQFIAIGTTSVDPQPAANFAPLNWDEFNRDLVVASKFSAVIGVYNLEGCVRRGYLARLKTFDWAQPAVIRADAIKKVILLRTRIQTVLWTGSHLLYFAAAVVLADVWLIRRRGIRKARAERTEP